MVSIQNQVKVSDSFPEKKEKTTQLVFSQFLQMYELQTQFTEDLNISESIRVMHW